MELSVNIKSTNFPTKAYYFATLSLGFSDGTGFTILSKKRTNVAQPPSASPSFKNGPYTFPVKRPRNAEAQAEEGHRDVLDNLVLLIEAFLVQKGSRDSKGISVWGSGRLEIGGPTADSLFSNKDGVPTTVSLLLVKAEGTAEKEDSAAGGTNAMIELELRLLGIGDIERIGTAETYVSGSTLRSLSIPSFRTEVAPATENGLDGVVDGSPSASVRSSRKGSPGPPHDSRVSTEVPASSPAPPATGSALKVPAFPVPYSTHKLETTVPLETSLPSSRAPTNKGDVLVEISVLYAVQLPILSPDTPVEVFVTAKSTQDAAQKRPAKAATTVAGQATNPFWNQLLKLTLSADDLDKGAGLLLTCADNVSKRELGKYIVPVTRLQPARQYNWLLMKEQGPWLRVDLAIHRSQSEVLSLFPGTARVKVLMKGISTPAKLGSVQATIRVVPNGPEYWAELATRLNSNPPEGKAALDVTPVSVEAGTGAVILPESTDGNVPSTPKDGSGVHVTLPSEGFDSESRGGGRLDAGNPLWNQLFVLGCSKATLETPHATLVVEVFQYSNPLQTPRSTTHLIGAAMIRLAAVSAAAASSEPGAPVAVNDASVYLFEPGPPMTLSLEMSIENSGQDYGSFLELEDSHNDNAVSNAHSVKRPTVPSLSLKTVPAGPEPGMVESYVPSYSYTYSDEEGGLEAESRRWNDPTYDPLDMGDGSRPMLPPLPGKQGSKLPPTSKKRRGLRESSVSFDPADELKGSTGYPTQEELLRLYSPHGNAFKSLGKDAQLSALTEDLRKKQLLIDRLLNEIDQKGEALRVVGADMQALRRANTRLVAENQDVKSMIVEKTEEMRVLSDVGDVDSISREELTRKYITLASRYKAEERVFADNQLRVEELQNQLIVLNEREKHYLELENAHTAQAAFIQQLQEENVEVARYKKVMKQQEEVISHLESLIRKHVEDNRRTQMAAPSTDLKSPRPPRSLSSQQDRQLDNPTKYKHSFDSWELDELKRENYRLKSRLMDAENHCNDLQRRLNEVQRAHDMRVQDLQRAPMSHPPPVANGRDQVELQQLRSRNAELEADLKKALSTAGAGDLDSQRLLLLMRAERAEARAQSLEAQLLETTRKMGRQIADLKMRSSVNDMNGPPIRGPHAGRPHAW